MSLTNGTSDINFTVYKGSPDKKIIKDQNHRDNLVGDQLLIRMTHSGLCGSDEHFTQADMCLGHEGAGIVEAVGPKASYFKVGETVAFGFQRGACGTCSQCLDGHDTYCPEVQFYGYCDPDVGSMASHTVFREAFCYRIPEGMAPDTAAGLMCGGATVFNIFDNYDVKPTHRVGVIGL